MAMSQIEKDGQAARKVVKAVYPNATSSYTETGAEVYDADTREVLGVAEANEFAVEHAWVAAAAKLQNQSTTQTPNQSLHQRVESFFDRFKRESQEAKDKVLARYPQAVERSNKMGFDIVDASTDKVLGTASYVDYAELQAWQDAAEKLENS